MPTAPQLVVGTAGHIDHGKSRLVWTLTGTDPDRLPEEKARGMTIDLGFAHAAIDGCDVWFVDVPGHERFIRNMVAGATGVDVALLVVAADDGVMPQTREHIELLSLLGVERCLLVLTKLDLVDEEWADIVESEARTQLKLQTITPLGSIRTSAVDGRGMSELKAALARLARECSAAGGEQPRWFRLPIDRAFSVPGRGTVVTGSLYHGTVRSDDELELWPQGTRVRVRDLQTHHAAAESAAGRMRLALNLAGVPLEQVRRGCELCTPGCCQATRRLDVHLHSFRMPGRAVRRSVRVRLHLATSELLAELRLSSPPAAPAISGVFARLRLTQPVVAAWGQRFVLRDESGERTLGGGRVLRALERPWCRDDADDQAVLRLLSEGAPRQRVEMLVRSAGWESLTSERLAAGAGIRDAEEAERLRRQLGTEGRLRRLPVGGAFEYCHSDVIEAISAPLADAIRRHLDANPRSAGVPRREWATWMPRSCPRPLRAGLADWLLSSGKFSLVDEHVLPAGHARAMPAADQALLDAILSEFAAAAFQPPAPDALRLRTPKNARRVDELIELAATRGRLIRVGDGLWLHADSWCELVRRVSTAIAQRGELAVSDIRDLLGSTRKFVVPLAEYMDQVGLTRRNGDRRSLGPQAQMLLQRAGPPAVGTGHDPGAAFESRTPPC